MGDRKESLEAIRTADTICMARKAFERHVITERGEGRWLIQRLYPDGKPESTYWTEICVLRKNLYVGGDIQPVLFEGGYSASAGRVRWMGESESWGYIAEKAQAGLRSRESVWKWDAEVAVDDFNRWRAERREEEEGEGGDSDLDEDYVALALAAGDRSEFLEHLGDACDHDWDRMEEFHGMGEILDARVIYAHAALRRLSQLLDQEEAAKPAEAANA